MPPTITLHITDQSGRILRRIDMPAPMREPYPGGPPLFDPARLDQLLDRACQRIREEAAHGEERQ